jgi:hypothetical protein
MVANVARRQWQAILGCRIDGAHRQAAAQHSRAAGRTDKDKLSATLMRIHNEGKEAIYYAQLLLRAVSVCSRR